MMSKIKICYLIIALLLIDTSVFSNVSQKNGYDFLPQYILKSGSKETFSIVENGKAAKIYVDPSDWKGVIRAAKDLGDDIKKVTTVSASVVEESNFNPKSILIGTIGKSAIIDKLIAEKKIDVSPILNKWESFIIQTVEDNLVIVGSDKRATIFGIYDISEKIGVSPWYWWADVPVKTSKELFVKNGTYLQESPKVKYRGIFINDEWPSFGDWTHRKFGGFNSKMYTHMFELLLRLKANYLWPAMWAVQALQPVGAMPLIPRVVELRFVLNPGMAFSLLSGKQLFLIIATSVALLAVAYGLFFRSRGKRLQQAALVLVLGGGIGNLIDRVLNGEVVDYINLLFMRFAVFNFADICVCVGVALWVLVIFLDEVHADDAASKEQ